METPGEPQKIDLALLNENDTATVAEARTITISPDGGMIHLPQGTVLKLLMSHHGTDGSALFEIDGTRGVSFSLTAKQIAQLDIL